jgi:hypothetical protein
VTFGAPLVSFPESCLTWYFVWVWVYNSTVYNTKGTTWSGSPPWK